MTAHKFIASAQAYTVRTELQGSRAYIACQSFFLNFSDFLGEVQVNYPDFVWPLMALIFVTAISAIFIILFVISFKEPYRTFT